MFSKHLISSFIDKVTTGAYCLVLFISNVASVADPSGRYAVGGLAARSAGTSELFKISDITQSPDHTKPSSVLQLIKSTSGNFQKLLKHFSETTTFVFNTLLLAAVPPVVFVLYSKDLLFVVLLLFNI